MTKRDSQPATDYKRLFDATPKPLLVLDLDFHIVDVNPAFIDVTMKEREAILGRHVLEVFPDNPADPDATGSANFRASLEAVRRDEKPDAMPLQRYDMRRPDGTFEERFWQPLSTPVFDERGELCQILHEVEDVTEVVRLRERGETLEARHRDILRDLFMSAPAMVVVLREPGHIIEMVNNPAREWFGDLDLEGKPLAEALPRIADTDRLEKLDEVYRTGEQFATHRDISHFGRPVAEEGDNYVSYVLQPLHDENGGVDRIVIFGFDVTEYVDARQKIEALASQAQEESRNKDQFLAMLGHELRNPMAAISTAVYVLKSATAGGLPEDRLRWGLDIIDRQLEQLTRLVNDLLDVARINEGRIDLQQEQISPNEIVRRAIETVRPLVDEREQTLEANLGDEKAHICADITRMTQVVANLLNNAAKYTQTGGRIEVDTGVEGGHAFIEVRDNGQGIEEELLPHVFELFKQADVSLDRSQGGLGLGLTLVKQLVEMHGGRVEAHSEGKGRGSTFVVELPLTDRPGDVLGLTATGDDCPPESRRVLIVDDNRDAADSLAMLLRVDGHTVDVAHDGQSALDLARDFEPEVALLDIGLPILDGYEVARRLREMDQTRDTILVAITGYGQESDRRFSEEAGFAYHLVKPVNHKRLRQVLSWIGDEE